MADAEIAAEEDGARAPAEAGSVDNPLAESPPSERSAGTKSEEVCPIGAAGASAWAIGRARATAERTELKLPRLFRIIGGALGAEGGGPTALLRIVQACCVAWAVSKAYEGPHEAAVQAAMEEPNALLYARNLCSGIGLGLASTMPLADMGGLRSGGVLDRLIAISGDASIGTRTARKLARFRNGAFVVGLVFLWMMARIYTQYFTLAMIHPENALGSVMLLVIGIPPFLSLILAVTLWLLSFRYGCAVVRDAATKVIYSATTVSPLDAEAWETQVARPAFELNESFKLLSTGWSRVSQPDRLLVFLS